MMQELAHHYTKLANGSDMLCMDTDVGLVSHVQTLHVHSQPSECKCSVHTLTLNKLHISQGLDVVS